MLYKKILQNPLLLSAMSCCINFSAYAAVMNPDSEEEYQQNTSTCKSSGGNCHCIPIIGDGLGGVCSVQCGLVHGCHTDSDCK